MPILEDWIEQSLDMSQLDVNGKKLLLTVAYNIVSEVPYETLVESLEPEGLHLVGLLQKAPNQTVAILWAIAILGLYHDEQGE